MNDRILRFPDPNVKITKGIIKLAGAVDDECYGIKAARSLRFRRWKPNYFSRNKSFRPIRGVFKELKNEPVL